jgi:hypothetical protein
MTAITPVSSTGQAIALSQGRGDQFSFEIDYRFEMTTDLN